MNHEMIEPKVTAIMNELVTTKKQYQIDSMSGNFYSQNDIVDVLRSTLATIPEPGINLQEAWISVEDMLPEDEFAYLVCIIVGSSPLPQVSRYPCYYYPESKIWLPIDSPHPMENVTHWIEFPAPPLSHLEAKEGRG